MQTIAVIGAGPKGRAFCKTLAQAGFRVVLEDVMPSRLRDASVELSSLTSGEVVFVTTVEDAVRDADFAIDFVPDELESKLELVCMIDRMAPPKTIILIQTTALSVGDLAACTYRAERCIGVRIGEGALSLVRGIKTADETYDAAAELTMQAGWQVEALEDRVVMM